MYLRTPKRRNQISLTIRVINPHYLFPDGAEVQGIIPLSRKTFPWFGPPAL
jgi:hypothetical protein